MKRGDYNHRAIEKKWQKYWDAKKTYLTPKIAPTTKKVYVLDEFPYPSGDGLHTGHTRIYTASDIYARLKRMQGYQVLHPMGWDAFGLPAEQYAIKHKMHPSVSVKKNTDHFRLQMKALGLSYDWSREINTTDPTYYKWTQWVFLQFYKKGLAYQSYEPINWCPSCQTGLANEDLEDGQCERCGSVVEKKPMRQWVLKITKYADRLLKDLDLLPWPESIKESQRHWIGRREGLLFTAPVKNTNLKIQTFSAHFEAFKADTFVVIAPDHPILPKLVAGLPTAAKILSFAKKLVDRRSKQNYATQKEIEGIFTGRYIVDPVGNGDLPIWVASYALADYGTGIVKCSAHDARDFAFAKKYGISLKVVLVPKDSINRKQVEDQEVCFSDMTNGVLLEPKTLAGRVARDVRNEVLAYTIKHKLATKKTTYKLRDWVFSRQRYWGEPIPMIHCERCGVVPVPEKDLPVMLPKVKSYAPTGTGESPLADIKSWVNVRCPKCKRPAKRETNTMPQWAGSSWYYLRYLDPKNKAKLVAKADDKHWSPVDVYVGGAEHVTRHLIYARFWHKFLYDLGVVNYSEPFTRRIGVGLILGAGGVKMSKRLNNVINPDDIIKIYGADTLRLYEMFIGPFGQAAVWQPDSIIGPRKFLERVWRLREKVPALAKANRRDNESITLDSGLEAFIHSTIKKVTTDIEEFNFNTAISALMILTNRLTELTVVPVAWYRLLLQLLAPLAPHLTEELWQSLGEKLSIHQSKWPTWDEAKLTSELVRLVVQVNGKTRDRLDIPRGAEKTAIAAIAMSRPGIQKWLQGKTPIKMIYIKDRLLNLVLG